VEARWTAYVVPYVGTTRDEYGNVTDTWGSPVPKKVFGWGAPTFYEYTISRDTVTIDIELLAPSGFEVNPKDKIRLDGQTYDVQGGVEAYNRGPFGFDPGVRVKLRRFQPA
jgi:hypothetical protein